MAKKESWISKLKEDARLLLKGKKGTKHSPAGKKYLKQQKAKKAKKTQAVYFKNVKRKSDVERLKEAGIDEKTLKRFGFK